MANWLKRMLLPWETIKYAKKKTKKSTDKDGGVVESVKNASRKDNHKSIYGGVHNVYGRFIDPLYPILGENYFETYNEKWPEKVNKKLSPLFEKASKLDPLTHVGG